ncbi:TonB-dependent receptor [Massilia terrae]|uniref:TonB-dependent receptor n=1 Tax=Massilia terrae TaxID=1811224 RepID=A0ABT2CUZ2_9BURK|nr:TonB-dependent receptor [Massilia terrae]MCS0657774.1 TonB-dependent receptor [Massilia terrae]
MNNRTNTQWHAPLPIASAVAMAVLAMSVPAFAQEAPSAPMAKVEITGSSIKRAAADQPLPITVTKADDWIAQGAVTVADILMSMSTAADYEPNTTSGNGNSANMRGIGAARTLVLLDGKRLSDSSIDPNTIPTSALDRTEVLRDGASSIYGSDAIGGVINFVTKKAYNGASITAKGTVPKRKGGGENEGLSFIVGKGDLAKDGWNVYLTGDLNNQLPLSQTSRPNITNSDRLMSAGFEGPHLSKGTNAVPANVTLANGSTKVGSVTITGNPYYSTGCLAPFSVQGTSNTCASTYTANSLTLTTAKKQGSLFLKGSKMLGEDNKLTATLLYSSIYTRPVKNPTFGINASVTNFPALTITPTSPFYPGKGITPAMNGITNQTLTLAWSLIGDLGPTVLNYQKSASRITVEDEGHLGAWDYKVGVFNAVYATETTFRSGFVNSFKLLDGVANGKLNPFGLQDQTGKDYLKSISTDGETANKGLTRLSGAHLTVNRDLMQLSGGTLAFAAGASMYHDYGRTFIPPSVALSGGQTGTTAAIDVAASRNVSSVYAELDAPLTKSLDVDLAVRTDRYSDFGSTTNPKVSFRYKPTDWLAFRGAVGTGFRAPTLNERYFGAVNGPTGVTSSTYNDPVLCPGGKVGGNTGGTALPGYTPTTVCAAKLPINTGANPSVGPEKSETINFGIVLTPTNSLLVSLDYWNVRMKDAIGQLAQATLFQPQYANLFIRDPKTNMLVYIDDRLNNMGGQRTDGIDVTATYTFPRTRYGRFGVQLDGTYVHSFKTQLTNDSDWIDSVNKFGPLDANVFTYRWRYTMSEKWQSAGGDWTSTLTETYRQSFEDLNASSLFYHRIDPYLLVNWSLSYSGFKNWTLMGGINNLFDRDPPAANYRNEGYLSGQASPVGRAFNLRATYKF